MTEETKAAPGPPAELEPNLGFIDSRRLTGPSRYFDGPAVTLTPIGAAASGQARSSGGPRAFGACRTRWMARSGADDRSRRRQHFPGVSRTARCAVDGHGAIRMGLGKRRGRGRDHRVRPGAGLGRRSRRGARSARRGRAGPQTGGSARGRIRHALPLFEDDEDVSIAPGLGTCAGHAPHCQRPTACPGTSCTTFRPRWSRAATAKTTTVRLLASMAAAAGNVPGYSCTEGVFVAGRPVALGDYSGPAGARAVLRHSDVTLAILETARGGICGGGSRSHGGCGGRHQRQRGPLR